MPNKKSEHELMMSAIWTTDSRVARIEHIVKELESMMKTIMAAGAFDNKTNRILPSKEKDLENMLKTIMAAGTFDKMNRILPSKEDVCGPVKQSSWVQEDDDPTELPAWKAPENTELDKRRTNLVNLMACIRAAYAAGKPFSRYTGLASSLYNRRKELSTKELNCLGRHDLEDLCEELVDSGLVISLGGKLIPSIYVNRT